MVRTNQIGPICLCMLSMLVIFNRQWLLKPLQQEIKVLKGLKSQLFVTIKQTQTNIGKKQQVMPDNFWQVKLLKTIINDAEKAGLMIKPALTMHADTKLNFELIGSYRALLNFMHHWPSWIYSTLPVALKINAINEKQVRASVALAIFPSRLPGHYAVKTLNAMHNPFCQQDTKLFSQLTIHSAAIKKLKWLGTLTLNDQREAIVALPNGQLVGLKQNDVIAREQVIVLDIKQNAITLQRNKQLQIIHLRSL